MYSRAVATGVQSEAERKRARENREIREKRRRKRHVDLEDHEEAFVDWVPSPLCPSPFLIFLPFFHLNFLFIYFLRNMETVLLRFSLSFVLEACSKRSTISIGSFYFFLSLLCRYLYSISHLSLLRLRLCLLLPVTYRLSWVLSLSAMIGLSRDISSPLPRWQFQRVGPCQPVTKNMYISLFLSLARSL